jgi:hypothetical protein
VLYGGAAEPADIDADVARGELVSYAESEAAEAKERFVRSLARAFKRLGFLKGLDENAVTLGEIVAVMRDGTSGMLGINGKGFKAVSETQQKFCNSLAAALNEAFSTGYGQELVRVGPGVTPAAVCQQVYEWASSFAAGVNTEYLAVHAAVRNSVANLEVLQALMAKALAAVREQATTSSDKKFRRSADALSKHIAELDAEFRRQLELLKEILKVRLPPVARTLEKILERNALGNEIVRKLDLTGKPLSEAMSAATASLGYAAEAAANTDALLKDVAKLVDGGILF